jgi:hypothetical protein
MERNQVHMADKCLVHVHTRVTLVAVAALLPESVASSGAYLVIGLISALLSLWFKG